MLFRSDGVGVARTRPAIGGEGEEDGLGGRWTGWRSELLPIEKLGGIVRKGGDHVLPAGHGRRRSGSEVQKVAGGVRDERRDVVLRLQMADCRLKLRCVTPSRRASTATETDAQCRAVVASSSQKNVKMGVLGRDGLEGERREPKPLRFAQERRSPIWAKSWRWPQAGPAMSAADSNCTHRKKYYGFSRLPDTKTPSNAQCRYTP